MWLQGRRSQSPPGYRHQVLLTVEPSPLGEGSSRQAFFAAQPQFAKPRWSDGPLAAPAAPQSGLALWQAAQEQHTRERAKLGQLFGSPRLSTCETHPILEI